MTEISKMYENAGFLKKQCKDYSCIVCEQNNNCEKYPPFTAEKQLKIIEWFISCSWWLNLKSLDKTLDFSLDFDEKLAKLVNRLWESFDDQEKDEIRRILNENGRS